MVGIDGDLDRVVGIGLRLVALADLGRDLDAARFASYTKLAGELAYEERRIDPAAARAQREEWKRITKAMRRDRDKP